MENTYIYIVQENIDKTEGRGPIVNVCAFNRKCDAQRAAMRLGTFGNVQELNIYYSYGDYTAIHIANIKKKALAKLTQEEREALGLEE